MDEDQNTKGNGYSWETEYEKTWESLKEDASGSIQQYIDQLANRARHAPASTKAGVTLGMVRHVYVALDMSSSMSLQDLKPSRQLSTLRLLEWFLQEFFDQNPLSQLGILIMQQKRAQKLTELGGSVRHQVKAIQKLKHQSCQGEPSIQNTLELALETLKHTPRHTSKEVLVIMGALNTCDPGEISDTVCRLQKHSISVSFIGLSAELHICSRVARQTGGTYSVILDESHLRRLLASFVVPPALSQSAEACIIKMGFPRPLQTDASTSDGDMLPSQTSSLDNIEGCSCICHPDSKPSKGTFSCFQCRARYCELPTECRICGLTLILAPQLARCYHHLFPVSVYEDLAVDSSTSSTEPRNCYSCLATLAKTAYRCPRCNRIFCADCDILVHEILHSCPGCSATQQS